MDAGKTGWTGFGRAMREADSRGLQGELLFIRPGRWDVTIRRGGDLSELRYAFHSDPGIAAWEALERGYMSFLYGFRRYSERLG